MKKTGLFFLFTIQTIFAFEALLTIDNFVENGDGTVTFDIMILNDEDDVQAVQLTLLSGDGIYDEGNSSDACQCSFECNDSNPPVCEGVIPDGCVECYYDNGLDFVANTYEDGYYKNEDTDNSGNSVYNGCSEDGECSDSYFWDSADCEEYGACNNGYTSDDYICFINGIIYLQFSDQEACEAAGLDPNGDICDGANPDCTSLGWWGAYDSSNCAASGVCSSEEYTNEAACVQDLGNNGSGFCDGYGCTWTSDNYIWSPTSLWTSYSLPYICNDNGYEWNYANQDASGDDYRVLINPSSCTEAVDCAANPNHVCCTTEFQFCRMPGINSTDPSNLEVYQVYQGLVDLTSYDVSGHCSQRDAYCRDLECEFNEFNGYEFTCYEDLNEDGVCDSGGTACDNGFPNASICNNSLNSGWTWISPHRDYVECTENEFTWTAYDTQVVCEEYGGIWVGDESGTQGNDMYDVGENFIDTDRNLDITSVTNLPGGFYASEANDEILIFSFSGEVIPSTDNYQRLATIEADITGTSNNIVTLGARNICKDNYQLHCVSEMIISDPGAQRLEASFIPSIWIIGSGANPVGSDETSSDDICSHYAGETIIEEDACPSICGDYYCDEASENYVTCKMDCPDAVNGDGYCNLYEGENAGTSADCTAFGCGDYYCDEASEGLTTNTVCSSDCLSYCGDGYCDVSGGENEYNCDYDCFGGDCNASIPGDVNSDEWLDILDILQIVNFSMDFITPTPYQECVADLNQDNFINILDILILVNIILNQ